MKSANYSTITGFFPKDPFLTLCISILIGWFFHPNLCSAAQRTNPDSLTLLTINNYKYIMNEQGESVLSDQPKKISYIAEGATVNLILKDRREIDQVQIDQVNSDHIVIGDERIAFSSIGHIELGTTKQRRTFKIFGTIILILGLACTGVVVGVAAYWGAGFLLPLIAWIPGGIWVNALMKKFPRFDLNMSYLSLGTAGKSGLSEKIHKRLARSSRFYHKRL